MKGNTFSISFSFWEVRLPTGPLLALPTAAMHSSLRTLYEIFSQRKRPTVGIALSRLTICEKKEGQKSEHLFQGAAPVPALEYPVGHTCARVLHLCQLWMLPVGCTCYVQPHVENIWQKDSQSCIYFLLKSDSKNVLGKCIYLFNFVRKANACPSLWMEFFHCLRPKVYFKTCIYEYFKIKCNMHA